MYICMYKRTHVCTVCIYVCICEHMYLYMYICVYVHKYVSSSSSSSCRAACTDMPDPLSPLLPIIHRLWQVFRATSRILS